MWSSDMGTLGWSQDGVFEINDSRARAFCPGSHQNAHRLYLDRRCLQFIDGILVVEFKIAW